MGRYCRKNCRCGFFGGNNSCDCIPNTKIKHGAIKVMLPFVTAMSVPLQGIAALVGVSKALGASWVGVRTTKWITDNLISKEIKNAMEVLKKTIQDWSEVMGKNIAITVEPLAKLLIDK